MSNQITTAFVEQYSNNVQMLSQQKGSLLRGSVDVETVVVNAVGVQVFIPGNGQKLREVMFQLLRELGRPIYGTPVMDNLSRAISVYF